MKGRIKMMAYLLTAMFVASFTACGAKSQTSQSESESDSSAQASYSQTESDAATINSSAQSTSDTPAQSASDTPAQSASDTPTQSTSDTPTQSASDNTEITEESLELLSPSGEVFPYIQNVTEYLQAGADAKLSSYYYKVNDAYAAVTVEWKNTIKGATAIKVEYSTNEDLSDAVSVELGADKTKLELYNLLKATEYYLRVTALKGGEEVKSAETTFYVTDLGPRMMNIGGIYNVRDLGGYLTESGERTVQGLFFRGGALSESTDTAYSYVALDESGKAYMSETLGIKTDFDLRNAEQNLGLTESPIPNATLEYYNIGGYLSAFSQTEQYRAVFSALSDQSRYPVYMHCTGGADRTGTVAFLINALLGVDETALIQDYELTSFSIYGKRDSNGSTYDFKPFLTKLKKYEGETLAQKTENYMLSIGVTETEIYNIRAIMLGKPCKLDVQAQEEFVAKKDTVYKITLNKAAEVSKVEIGGEEVIFAVSGNEIVVQKADLPQGLQNGSVGGLAVIDGMEYPFTFNYDGKNYLSAFPEGDGTMTLDQTYTSVSGSTAIGYDGTVAEVTVVKVEDDSSGGTYFMLGSYGVYVRGGSFRVAVATNGQFAECKPRVEPVYLANTTFKAGISLGLAVTVKDDSTVTLAIYVNGEEKGTCDIARVADELPSEESVFTVSINAQAVTQLIIGKVTPIVSVNAPATFGVSLDEELKIALRGTTEVDKVLIGEAEVNYTVKDGEIVIAKADLPQNLQNGDVSGVVVIGGVEYPFSFTYDGTKYADGLTSGDGTITLTSENTSAAGEKVIGYDGTIAKVTVAKVEDDSNGGTYFMVGSYGVYVRGGSFRAAVMKDGACSEYSPRVQPALLANYTFKAGISLGLAVTIKDDTTVTITVYVNGENAGSCDIPRVSDEIASDQAKFLVQITSYVTSLEISGVKQ